MIKKLCPDCKILKILSEYNKNRSRYDGLQGVCRICERLRNQMYQKQNPQKVNAKTKRWRIANPGKWKTLNRKSAAGHRMEINEYRKIRYHTEPQLRVSTNLRTGLRSAIKAQNATKVSSAIRDCGLTSADLCAYIESLWKPGMDWSNYSYRGWHVDHIRPLSSFDLRDPEQQKIACHYTNLQPLWAEENFKKSDKYEP